MNLNDAHIHLFERGYRGNSEPDAEVAQYESIRSRRHVATALVVGYEGESHQGNNAYLLGLAKDREWIAPLPYLSLATAAVGEVEEWWAAGAVGLALYLNDAAELGQVDPDLWRFLQRHRAILSVNARAGVWARAHEWVRQLEGAQILVSHLGLPGPLVGEGPDVVSARIAPVLALAAYAHVGVKLSGAYAIDPTTPHVAARPVVEEVLDVFGASRVVWGSDYSPALETMSEDDLFSLPAGTGRLSNSECAEVTGGTLAGVLERVCRA